MRSMRSMPPTASTAGHRLDILRCGKPDAEGYFRHPPPHQPRQSPAHRQRRQHERYRAGDGTDGRGRQHPLHLQRGRARYCHAACRTALGFQEHGRRRRRARTDRRLSGKEKDRQGRAGRRHQRFRSRRGRPDAQGRAAPQPRSALRDVRSRRHRHDAATHAHSRQRRGRRDLLDRDPGRRRFHQAGAANSASTAAS